MYLSFQWTSEKTSSICSVDGRPSREGNRPVGQIGRVLLDPPRLPGLQGPGLRPNAEDRPSEIGRPYLTLNTASIGLWSEAIVPFESRVSIIWADFNVSFDAPLEVKR
jgi:hypothetical protein